MQTEMAEASRAAPHDEAVAQRPLGAVEPKRLDRILARWREAQLRLELAKPGSPEAEAAAVEIERVREEYREAAHERAEEHGTG